MDQSSAFKNAGLLALHRAAELLGIAPPTLRAWTYRRRIGFVQLGRRKLFHPDEIARFVRQHTVPAREAEPVETGVTAFHRSSDCFKPGGESDGEAAA